LNPDLLDANEAASVSLRGYLWLDSSSSACLEYLASPCVASCRPLMAPTWLPSPTVFRSRGAHLVQGCCSERMLCGSVGCEVRCEAMEAPSMPKFDLTPVDEVRLYRAPLAKVLMQVQYSRTPELVTDGAEALVAEALARYPVRRRQIIAAPNVVVNGQHVQLPGNVTPGVALSFSDPKSTWQVSVTETAVALETTDYGTRDDFCARADEIFAAIASVTLPPVVDRVGIRYIDRLTGDALGKVPMYVMPELSALVGHLNPPLALHHSITESEIEIDAGERMLVRSGLLPPGSAFDPALPVVPEQSWVLDMDVFTTQAGFPFDPEELTRRLRRYAETVYAFFRFATTEAFQEAHRIEPPPIAEEAS
jgi:uncharacterized protein (TIGR04255 family)